MSDPGTEPFVSFAHDVNVLNDNRWHVIEYRGVIRLERDDLVIEFTSRRSISNAVETPHRSSADARDDVTTVRMPLAHVGSLTQTGGLFRRPRLRLETSRVGALAAVPWAEGTTCVLPLSRRDARPARELRVELQMRLADARLDRLNELPGDRRTSSG
jgi:hypothetical protein